MKKLAKEKSNKIICTYKVFVIFSLVLNAFYAQAQPAAPSLHINTEGTQVTLNWSTVSNATSYRLFYTPYPYQPGQAIDSLDLATQTSFSINLWQNASYYVAIKAYDINHQSSEYSNIGYFQILERGEDYRHFWQLTIDEINDEQFVSDDFLYLQLPVTTSCFEGKLNILAQQRQTETLNQVRLLHGLSAVIYDDLADNEVQNASLLQRANNSLTHTPTSNAKCFSQSAFNGSKSSNLNLSNQNLDPAKDIISLIDDAFNISTIAAAGHRRHLLNPFLQSTSYGQVFGATAVKVLDFSDNVTARAENSPKFVAFPYLRYPYLFFSDKTSIKKTPWNLTIVEDTESKWGNKHDYFINAKVSVRQKDNNQKMEVHDQYTDTQGLGVPNNLSWTINDWQYDTWYTVLVENIDYQSGETTAIEYDVFIDYKNFFNISYPLESGDTKKDDHFIQGILEDKHDKDSFIVTLGGNTNFSGSSQFSNMGFFISIYDADKKLIKSSDNSFVLDLPSNIYTLIISNCSQSTCYNGEKEYSIQIN